MLQTFPDSFVFSGNLSSQYRQIGNAVPVLLAEKIGLEIIKKLDEYEKNFEKGNIKYEEQNIRKRNGRIEVDRRT